MTKSRQYFVARLNEAIALHRQGDVGGAAQLYRAIIAEDPAHADAYQLLAVIARQMGQKTLALQLLETALTHAPRHAPALANHALLLREDGDLAFAKRQAEAALAVEADYAEAHIVLGGVLQAMRDPRGALRHYEIALRKKPDDAELHNNIAAARQRLGQLPEAYQAIMQALKRAPDAARFHNTRGNILRASGHADLASAAFEDGLGLEPENTDIAVNAAMTHLLTGHFARGWDLFARRGGKSIPAGLAAWGGTSDSGTRLLITAEQGMGDMIQFSRLLPWARTRAGSVTLAVQKPLCGLMAAAFPDINIIAAEDGVPEGVTHACRLLDLAGMMELGLTGEIPGGIPWLRAPDLPPPLEDMLAARKRPAIGLVWAGNPGHLNDANRSLKLESFAPHLAPFAEHLISIQKGPQAEELAESGLAMPDGGARLNDFAETAALLQNIDLLLTIDTSVAHLAGALGRPCWVMLPYDPDWRWGLERRDVPFYPATKLYRQAAPGDWDGVMRDIVCDLAAFLAGDAATLSPPRWQGGAAKRHNNPTDLTA